MTGTIENGDFKERLRGSLEYSRIHEGDFINIREGRSDLVPFTPERARLNDSAETIAAKRQALLEQYPAWSDNIANAEKDGHSLDDIHEELSRREMIELFKEGRSQFDVDVEYGRTPETKAAVLKRNRKKRASAYYGILRGTHTKAQVDELLHVAQITNISPSVLMHNDKLYEAAKRHAGRIGSTMEYVGEFAHKIIAGWYQGRVNKKGADAAWLRDKADASNPEPQLVPIGRGNGTRMETPKEAAARQAKLVERARRDYQKFKNDATWFERNEGERERLRPPDSMIGAFLISVAESAGFSIQSGLVSGMARVVGGILGSFAGGAAGGGASMGVGTIPGAITGVKLGADILGAIASIFNANLEAKMEAGAILMDKIYAYRNDKMSFDDAFEKAAGELKGAMDEVYRNNMLWLGATNVVGDKLTLGTSLLVGGAAETTVKMTAKAARAARLKDAMLRAAQVAVGSMVEGLEEGGQEIIKALALDEEIDAGAVTEAFAMGMGHALFYSGVGRSVIALGHRFNKQGITPPPSLEALAELARMAEAGEISHEEAFTKAQELAKEILKAGEKKLNADTPDAASARTYRDAIRKALNGHPNYTEEQAETYANTYASYLLAGAEKYGMTVDEFHRLQIERDETTGTSGDTFFQNATDWAKAQERLDQDEAAWGNAVDRIASGKTSQRGSVKVMTTPLVLGLTGAKILPVYMNVAKIGRVMKEHGLTTELIKQIPRALADPVAIFKSATQSNGLVIMTELKDASGATVIVPFHLNVEHQQHGQGRYVVNKLASIYGKDKNKNPIIQSMSGLQLPRGAVQQGSLSDTIPHNQWFVNQIREGNLLYANEQKSSEWSESAGLSLSGENVIQSLVKDIPTETDLANLRNRNPGYYQGENGTPRASISFNRQTGDAIMRLFENADATSFTHELWHLALDDLIQFGDRETATEQAKADRVAALEWLGATDGKLSEDAHERWAKAGERYFMTGKAPTVALEGVFARVKKWMCDIYEGLIGEPIPEHIQDIFDRMLATPEEITAAYEARTTIGELAQQNKLLKERIKQLDEEIAAAETEVEHVDAEIKLSNSAKRGTTDRAAAQNGQVGETFYQPANPGVNPEQRIPILDLGNRVREMKTLGEMKAHLKSLIGQEFISADAKGMLGIRTGGEAKHVAASSHRPRSGEGKAVRNDALLSIDELASHSFLVESHENTDPNKRHVESIHRFYAVVKKGGKLYTVRIVTEKMKGSDNLLPIDADIYDVLIEKSDPSTAPEPTEKVGTSGKAVNESLPVTIRDALQNVKDMDGKPYIDVDGLLAPPTGQVGETFYQPANPGVDLQQRIPVFDATSVFPEAVVANKETLLAHLNSLVGRGYQTFNDEAIINILKRVKGDATRKDKARHVVYSPIPTKSEHVGVRNVSVLSVENLIRNAVLIESIPNAKSDRKPDVAMYHRFYVPMRVGDNIYAVRLVVEEMEARYKVNPKDTTLYDIAVDKKTPLSAVSSSATVSGRDTAQRGANGDSVISINDMLSGVKDSAGADYAGIGETYETYNQSMAHDDLLTRFKTPAAEEFIAARDSSKRSMFLTPYTAQELQEKGAKLYLSDDGVGFALTADGDMIGVFNNSGRKGGGEEAVILAIAEGAKTCDCIGSFLRKYYKAFGFVESGRETWNDEYAPAGWDYETGGRPDVLFFEYPDGISRNPDDVRARVRAAANQRTTGGLDVPGVDIERTGRDEGRVRGRVDTGESETSRSTIGAASDVLNDKPDESHLEGDSFSMPETYEQPARVQNPTYYQKSVAENRLSNDESAWGKVINSVISGQADQRKSVKVMTTPLVLGLAGAKILPVYMSAAKISTVMKEHGLTVDLIKQVPRALADPVAVFKSATQPGGLVVMTELKDASGATVIVPFHLNVEHEQHGQGRYVVNKLASIYGKDKNKSPVQERSGLQLPRGLLEQDSLAGKIPHNQWFVNQINDGNLLYLDSRKSRAWFESVGMELPRGVSGVSNETDLVNARAQNSGYYQKSVAENRLSNDESAWGNAVDRVISGQADQRKSVKVMTTPLALGLAGAKILPVYMSAAKISTVMKEHGLTVDLIKQVPRALADPVAIFKSATQPGGLVVMTELKDANGATVIVPFHLNVEHEQHGQDHYVVNKLASIYGKDKNKNPLQERAGLQLPRGLLEQDSLNKKIPHNQWFVNQINDGNLLYLDSRKSRAWFESTGMELPGGISGVPNETDLVNARTQNPTYYQKSVAENRLSNDESAWGKLIDAFVEGGKLDAESNKMLPIMHTPLALQLAEAENLPISTSLRTLGKVLKQKHKLPAELVKQIPRALADPVMIFRPPTDASKKRDSLVVLSELEHNGVPVLVAVELHQNKGNYIVNEWSSAFPKNRSDKQQLTPAENIIDYIGRKDENGKGLLRYINKKKSLLWSQSASTGSLLEGTLERSPYTKSVPNETDLVNARTQNPGYYQKSVAENRLSNDESAWGNAVDRVISGQVEQRESVKVMTTPLALGLAGAKILPVHMNAGKISTVMKEHGLTADLIKQVPRALADPVAIFKSTTQPGGLVVMTELKDTNGATVIVPFHLNVEQGRNRYIVNKLASIYGKDKNKSPDFVLPAGQSGLQLPRGAAEQGSLPRKIPHNQWFVNQINDGNLLYLDSRKSRAWFESTGMEFPRGISGVPNEADLVNVRAQNPTYYQSARENDVPGIIADIRGNEFMKISLDDILDNYGDEILKYLPGGIVSPEGFQTADDIAQQFGYEDSVAFLNALAESLTDEQFLERAEQQISEWDAVLLQDEELQARQESPDSKPNIVAWIRANGGISYRTVKERYGSEDAKQLMRKNGPGLFSAKGMGIDVAAASLSAEGVQVADGDALLSILMSDNPQKSDVQTLRDRAYAEGMAAGREKMKGKLADVRASKDAARDRAIRELRETARGRLDDMRIQRNIKERIGKIEKAEVRKQYRLKLEEARQQYREKLQRKNALIRKRKEAATLRAEVKKLVEQLANAAKDTKAIWAKQEEIRELLSKYDLKNRSDKALDMRLELELFAAANPDAADSMHPGDVALFGTTPLSVMTIAEVRALHEEVCAKQQEGRELEEQRLAARQERIDQAFDTLTAPLMGKRKGRKGGVAGREDLKKQYKGLLGLVEKGVDWAYAATLGSQRFFDWLDDGRGRFNGAFVRYLCDNVNRARDKELRSVMRRREAMEEVLKEMGLSISDLRKEVVVEGVKRNDGQNFTRDEVLSIYCGLKNERSTKAIIFGNFGVYGENAQTAVNALVAQLTEEERAAADRVMMDYEANFDRINEAFVEAYNQGMEREKNYTPMRRLEYTTSEGLIDAQTGEAIMTAREGAGGLGKVDAGFLISRADIDESGQKGVDLGLFEIWLQQVDRQEHAAAFAGLLSEMRSVMTSRGRDVTMRELIVETHGKAAWSAFTEYYNTITRNNRAIANDVLSGASSWFARSMSVAYLCGNLGTVVKQTTSYPRLLAHAGPTHMLSAIGQFTANPRAFLDQVYELDPQLRDRQGNLMMRALKEAEMAGKAIDLMMEPIALTDRMTAAIGWKAVYDANLARGQSIEVATREAQRAVLLTQQTTHAKDAPMIWQQSSYVRLAMIFTSEAAQMWGMTIYDFAQSIRRGDIPDILSNGLALTLTAAMYKMMTDGPPDDDEDETWLGWFASALARQSVESMPLIGNEAMVVFDARLGGNGWKGTRYSAFVAPLDKLLYGVKGVFDDNEDNNERAYWSLIEAASLLGMPFPATAARRLWDSGKAAMDGEAAYAFLNMLGMRKLLRR